jgi:hypothetical protein
VAVVVGVCLLRLKIGQMTLRSKHLSALESSVANHPDVKLIFGDATMQVPLEQTPASMAESDVDQTLKPWTTRKMCLSPPLAAN